MTAERIRGTHDGRVVREALIDGAWVEVPDDDLDELLAAADEGEDGGSAEDEACVDAALPVRRRGRPRKSGPHG